MCPADITGTTTYARVAQLVEHDLAKVGAAGSSPVSRSAIESLGNFWLINHWSKKFSLIQTHYAPGYT